MATMEDLMDKVSENITNLSESQRRLDTLIAKNDDAVHLEGSEVITGRKDFRTSPIIPDGTASDHPVTKFQLDYALSEINATYAKKEELAGVSLGAVQYVSELPEQGSLGVLYVKASTTPGAFNTYAWKDNAYISLAQLSLNLSEYALKTNTIKSISIVGNNLVALDGNGEVSTSPIPDTTYAPATPNSDGLFSSEDKIKLDELDAKVKTVSATSYLSGGTPVGSITVGDNTTTFYVDDSNKYEDATWNTPGLMTAEDKYKLDSIEPEATSVKFVRTLGSGIKIGIFYINGIPTDIYCPSSVDYEVVTSTIAGLMSAQDKAKLDSIADNATKVSFSRSLTSGTPIGNITIDGYTETLYCKGTDVSYTPTVNSGVKLGTLNIGGDAYTLYCPEHEAESLGFNAQTINGEVYLNLVDATGNQHTVKLLANGGVALTTDDDGNVVISSEQSTLLLPYDEVPAANSDSSTPGTLSEYARGDHVHPLQTTDGEGNDIVTTYATKEELSDLASNLQGIDNSVDGEGNDIVATYATKEELNDYVNTEALDATIENLASTGEVYKAICDANENVIVETYVTNENLEEQVASINEDVDNKLSDYVNINVLAEHLVDYATKADLITLTDQILQAVAENSVSAAIRGAHVYPSPDSDCIRVSYFDPDGSQRVIDVLPASHRLNAAPFMSGSGEVTGEVFNSALTYDEAPYYKFERLPYEVNISTASSLFTEKLGDDYLKGDAATDLYAASDLVLDTDLPKVVKNLTFGEYNDFYIPDVYQLYILMVLADAIDAQDKTVVYHRGNALGCQNYSGRFESGFISSTAYDSSTMYLVEGDGSIATLGKNDDVLVLPVRNVQ